MSKLEQFCWAALLVVGLAIVGLGTFYTEPTAAVAEPIWVLVVVLLLLAAILELISGRQERAGDDAAQLTKARNW